MLVLIDIDHDPEAGVDEVEISFGRQVLPSTPKTASNSSKPTCDIPYIKRSRSKSKSRRRDHNVGRRGSPSTPKTRNTLSKL